MENFEDILRKDLHQFLLSMKRKRELRKQNRYFIFFLDRNKSSPPIGEDDSLLLISDVMHNR